MDDVIAEVASVSTRRAMVGTAVRQGWIGMQERQLGGTDGARER